MDDGKRAYACDRSGLTERSEIWGGVRGGVLGPAPGVTRPSGSQFRQKFHLFFGSLFWTKNQPFLDQKWTIFGLQKRGFSKENVDEKHGFSKHAKSQK